MYSDGAQIYQMLRGGPWAEVHQARAMVASSLVTPLRPAEWDGALLDRCSQFQKSGTDGILMRLYLVMHHADAGRWAPALVHLEAATALYPRVQKTFDAHLIPEILVMTALLKQDPAAARWWWHQFESKRKRADGLGYWSARTAWHWMEGHTADAWQALQQWEERAQKLPRTGAYDYDRRQAALLRTGTRQP